MRIICVFIMLTILSACATTENLEKLRQVTPKGTPYAINLAKHYLDFSESEAKKHDWRDSSYFAEKGLAYIYGTPKSAEEITNWNISEDLKPELIAARDKLLKLIDDSAKQKMPKQAAEASFAFDCWLEELDEGWDETAISDCQGRFYAAIDELEFNIISKTNIPEIQPDNTAYLVYFDSNSTQFDTNARNIIKQVILDIKKQNPSEVLIHGHTDSLGSSQLNMKLSEKRALSILEQLISNGVPKEILQYFAFGESDPVIDRGSNSSEPKNRRVEIFIG